MFAALVILTFFSLSTLYGIQQLGFCNKYSLSLTKANVLPNGLFVGGGCVGVSVIGLMYNWQIITPQYSTFGTQTYDLNYVFLLFLL